MEGDSAEIDTLLDQLEVKFLTNRIRYDPNRIVVSTEETRKCPCTSKTETDWEEVDKLLEDFELEASENTPATRNPWLRDGVSRNKVKEAQEVRCIPPYLAGSYEPMGHSTPGFEK